MKKIFSILLTVVLTLGMGSVAMAATATAPAQDFTLGKVYKLLNEGTVSPAETFAFSVTPDGISGATMPTGSVLPVVTLASGVAFTEGEATTTGDLNNLTIKLPEYRHVGIYTYKINETKGTTLGVSYDPTDLFLRVQVTEETGTLKATPAIYYGSYNQYGAQTSQKITKITNTYSAGTLAVNKKVAGNFGDKEKYFKVTVNFTVPAGEQMNSSITYSGGKYSPSQAVAAQKEGTFSQKIELKHDDTITFHNIPYGVTYTVVEDDYSSDGAGNYAVGYEYVDKGEVVSETEADKKIDGIDQVNITNTKNLAVSTGISLDSIPYILLLGFAIIGIGVLSFRKRQNAKF